MITDYSRDKSAEEMHLHKEIRWDGEAYAFGGKGIDMWYVVQVRTGMEEEIKLQCEKVLDKNVFEKCFLPYYIAMKKYEGEWHEEQKVLFPGYVFVISDDSERLFLELKKVLGLTKLLGGGQEIMALREEEIEFLKLFGTEKMIVEMSVGEIEDGQLKILDGPLAGMEKYIRKVDRHKRKAWIEVELGGERQETLVGLEVVRKS